jgi:hypothetical protein
MNQKKLCKTLFLAVLALPFLGGCSHSAVGTCYWTDLGTHYGNYVFRTTTSLSQGTITKATLEETYLPAVWARVNPSEFSTSSIETLEVKDAYLWDGTQGTVTFAKHIKVGDYSFTGTLRDETVDDDTPYLLRGDYVRYRYDGLKETDTESTLTDLNRYLAEQDTGVYKLGGHCGWYFEAVEKGSIHAYGSKTGSTALDVDYTLGFPDGKKLREESTYFTGWASAKTALCTYLQGKKLNYAYSTTDQDGNIYKSLKLADDKKTFMYNAGYANGVYSDDNWETLTGVTTDGMNLDTVKALFTGFNVAFASVEYSSLR